MDQNSAAALAAEIRVDGNGIEVDGSVARGVGIRRYRNGGDIRDCGRGDDGAKVLIKA